VFRHPSAYIDVCFERSSSLNVVSHHYSGEVYAEADISTDNVIREVLRHYANKTAPSSPSGSYSPQQTPSPHPGYLPAQQLHLTAERYCLSLLPQVVNMIKTNLYSAHSGSDLFKWDAGLVRDGLFFAGVLSASVGDEVFHAHASTEENMKVESLDMNPKQILLSAPVSGAENAVQLCIAALGEMRWVHSKASEREATLKTIWEDTMYKKHGGSAQSFALQPLSTPPPSADARPAPTFEPTPPPLNFNYGALSAASTSYAGRSYAAFTQQYPTPPPLLIPQRPHLESTPVTSSSTESNANSWLSYTPPDTSTTATSASASASPVDPQFCSNAASIAGHTLRTSPLKAVPMQESNFVEFPEDATPYFQPPPRDDSPTFSYNAPSLDTTSGYDASLESQIPEDSYLNFGTSPTDPNLGAQYHNVGDSDGYFPE